MESAFIGSLQLMQVAFPHMRDAGGGSMIIRCVASVAMTWLAAKQR